MPPGTDQVTLRRKKGPRRRRKRIVAKTLCRIKMLHPTQFTGMSVALKVRLHSVLCKFMSLLGISEFEV